MTTSQLAIRSHSVFLCIRNCPFYNYRRGLCSLDRYEPLKKENCSLREKKMVEITKDRVAHCPYRTRGRGVYHKCRAQPKHMPICGLHGSSLMWKCPMKNLRLE